MTTGENPNNKS